VRTWRRARRTARCTGTARRADRAGRGGNAAGAKGVGAVPVLELRSAWQSSASLSGQGERTRGAGGFRRTRRRWSGLGEFLDVRQDLLPRIGRTLLALLDAAQPLPDGVHDVAGPRTLILRLQ